MASVCIVIPARLGSTRLSEKALALIHGKPMIQHVWERARRVGGVDKILVATDHPRIEEAVHRFDGESVMTPESLQSGTDRVAFVANGRKESIFVNIQGDEPMLDPSAVEGALNLVKSGQFDMATPAAPLLDEEHLRNPNVVKALVAADGNAVYFSRYPIPYSRGEVPKSGFACRHHLGVYVYRRETLLKFASLPKSPWEAAESLEQLRALYHGIRIGVSAAQTASIGVDTADDLNRVKTLLATSVLG